MKISQLFQQKKAVYSFEIFPPKPTADPAAVQGTIEELSSLRPDYISVTCSAGGSGNARTGEIAQLVKRCGVEPLAHVTCINSDRSAVRNTLYVLHALGVEYVLSLRGDRQECVPESKDFAHAEDLVRFIREQGYPFDIAGACYPEGHPESETLFSDIENLKKKVDAGCDYLTTQMFFDNELFYSFLAKAYSAGITVPIIPGIMPITRASQVKRTMNLSGSPLPAKFRRIVDRFGDNPAAMRQAGVAYATEQVIDLYANGIKAVHIYSMNKPEVARAIKANLSDII